MKVSDFIIDYLAKYGVRHIFGYAGGAVTHLLDSIYQSRDMKFISVYHEQAAAFAAEGYARIKNDIGVALATSGPGATNLITGIGSAFFDSVPCLYITGQVNTYEYKGDSSVRQMGFQETDIVSIVAPITKYAARVNEAKSIQYELQKAIAIANSSRKGPVLLDIPMDIQRADIDPGSLSAYEEEKSELVQEEHGDGEWLNEVITTLNHSRRPVILAGGGVRTAGAAELLGEFAQKTNIPVVCSLMGLDVGYDDNFYGLIGAYGNRCANYALANSDLILALGSRLDTRQTGTNLSTFAREAKLIRIDIDEHELQRRIKNDELSFKMDIADFLSSVNKETDRISPPDLSSWHSILKGYQKKYPSYTKDDRTDPNNIMKKISEATKEGDIICLDVGQNQMWAAQSLELKEGQRLLLSGGMGAMGFSLPVAIGAYYASPDRNIIAIAGDGGFQMNIQELQLIKRNQLPIKIIIMNNNCLGMIRHFQEMYFEGRYGGTIIGYEAPDFGAVARGYGIESMEIEKNGDLRKIEKALNSDQPLLLCIHLPQTTFVYPKLEVGKPIEDQEPLLAREEFYSNMLIAPLEEK
ncbi:thiamine pyrophosphate-binding protein [Desulfosporosinus nitroreducens]|uniref:thiamine pyrophosphate-binding protein n=1 Tax=Desulfosporosinus nitroreducens TaxID=2018668 RepID=UPI00207C7DF6|nr:thiamine pyrophosphate-binding protein [Desulfosporosinus nitroreducens]MCO1603817.1 thiamine pyrophosphate-binding protein [Desulfosporosinus nitroreducens]